MRFSLRLLAGMFAAGLPFTLLAQSRQDSHSVTVRFSHSTENEVAAGGFAPADLSVNATRIVWQSALPMSESTRFSYGANWTRFDFDRPNTLPLPDTLDEIAIDLGLTHRLNDRWRLSAKISPGLYGDLENNPGDAFNAPVLALATWRQNASLAWSFGLRADAFSDNPVLPIIGVDWEISPTWRFTIGMPRAGFTYRATPELDIGLGVSVQGGNYRISDDPRPAGLSAVRPLNDTYLDYHEIRVGVAVDYRFTPALGLSLEAGIVTDQKFDYYDRDYSLNGGENAFFSLGVIGRF